MDRMELHRREPNVAIETSSLPIRRLRSPDPNRLSLCGENDQAKGSDGEKVSGTSLTPISPVTRTAHHEKVIVVLKVGKNSYPMFEAIEKVIGCDSPAWR